MTYDAVIIGAGPSGIAAAARLGHFGVKVCLVDAHTRPGGLNSWHFVNGREISSGLHAVTNYAASGRGGMLGKLFRQLRIKPSDLDLRPQGRSSIRFPGASLAFSNDPELIRQEIAARFPAEIDGFDRFRARVAATDEGEITDARSSARDMLARFIADPLLTEMLLCPVMFYGNPGGVGDGRDAERTRPDMDWLLFCVVWKCIFETGFAWPAGGMRPLWERLLARFREDGGEVRLGCRVARLEIADGRVVAAVTDSGEAIRGDLFFSSAGGRETGMLAGAAGGAALADLPAGEISIAEGILPLDRPAAEIGLADTTVFYSFADALAFRRPEGLVEASNGVACAPGNYAGVDENIVKVTQLASYPAWRALSGEEYAAAKVRTGEGMAEALGRLGAAVNALHAGAGRYGPFADVFTPLTLERFTGHAEGALYGSPVKRRSGRTGCGNLFLIGADQGFHGIVGAMLSGVAMANAHCLAKRGQSAF